MFAEQDYLDDLFAFISRSPTACHAAASGAALLLDDLCTALAGEREIDLFLDDFHLLRDEQAAAFLCALANRLPGNAHLVVASRNDFLPQGEILRLGQRLHRGDFAAGHRHVGPTGGTACAVVHGAAPDDEIKHGISFF